MSSPIDLSLLPKPDLIVPLDYEQILASRKATLLDLYTDPEERAAVATVLTLESEPMVKLLQEGSYHTLAQTNRINQAALAVMLAYARGSDLDQLGANVNTSRLLIAPADPDAVPPVDAIYEDDVDYVLRIQEAFDGLSTAGPTAAYERFARSAHGQVADARATSPSPAVVVIAVLSTQGDGTASPEVLAAVEAAVNEEERRPVADRVTAQSAQIIDYRINATLYVGSGPESSIARGAALDRLRKIVAIKRRLGLDVIRSTYIAALRVEGTKDVDLQEPAQNIRVSPLQAARCIGIDVRIEVKDD